MIFSGKYRQIEHFLENIPSQMLLLRIFWYTLDQFWPVFLANNGKIKIFMFSPIIKSVFPLYNLKKGGEARFSLKNSETLTPNWFGVYTAWVKRAASLEVSC